MQEPPGGPPDFTPPVVVSVVPDSGTVVDELKDPLLIRFDEVINEQSGGGLDRLVLLSPRVKELVVSWKRTAIEIKPKEGWRTGVVYHVTLLPGIADLRNNQLTEGQTIIFSTGGPIPHTHLRGTVLDWENGRAGRDALIEAVLMPDSLVYLARADSVGEFELTAIPRGNYLALASIDENMNRQRDPREAFDSTTVTVDSSATAVLWTFVHDTVGAQIRQLTQVDSATFRIEFNQKLAPGTPGIDEVLVWVLPDTTLVTVHTVWDEAVYDSVRTAEAAAAAAAADTAGAADTADTAEAAEAAEAAAAADTAGAAEAAEAAEAAGAADTSRIAELLAQRPRLSALWVVRLSEPMTPGARYLVEARARNVSGARATSRSVLVLPAPRDST